MPFSFRHFFSTLGCVSLAVCSPLLSDKTKDLGPIEIDLKEPTFKDGVLRTDQGGILTAKDIRLQARQIAYTNKIENGEKIVQITAEDNILLEYKGDFFVGSKLEYDFVTHTGTLWNGRTSQGIWFVGGDIIHLSERDGYTIENAFVTTSESQDMNWSIQAKSVSLSQDQQLSAKNINLNLFHIPVLWLPSFKSNLKFVADPPIRYRLVWDKGVGPRATIRYRFFSTENLNLFARLDYRLSKGLGAALESEYFTDDTRFITRSYGAHDKVVYDESGLKRYRLQGLFSHESKDHRTHTHLTYDKFSDLKIISDFPSTDFEIDTQKRTRLLINHQEDIAFSTLDLEPRLNRFESVNQRLPLVRAGVRPFNLGKLGILSENSVSAGYLDYVYAHELLQSHPALHEVHSARVQTRNRLYKVFSAGPLHLTPVVGMDLIFYNNNAAHRSVGQGVVTYGGDFHSPLYKRYGNYTHTIDPYIQYLGLTKPRANPSSHYTFNIDDGLHSINSLRVGLKNNFSSFFFTDLYTYGFFGHTPFSQTFPKSYLLITWSRPSYRVEGNFCWNFQERLLDFSNMLTELTVSEDAAFALEFRHRSRFDWRKADHESFLLDMAHPISEIRDSLLSDGRNTLLGRVQVRLSPKWNCHFASHFGWGRVSEPSYISFKVDAVTLVSSKWQLKFSYTHTTNDDRFAMQMQLAK